MEMSPRPTPRGDGKKCTKSPKDTPSVIVTSSSISSASLYASQEKEDSRSNICRRFSAHSTSSNWSLLSIKEDSELYQNEEGGWAFDNASNSCRSLLCDDMSESDPSLSLSTVASTPPLNDDPDEKYEDDSSASTINKKNLEARRKEFVEFQPKSDPMLIRRKRESASFLRGEARAIDLDDTVKKSQQERRRSTSLDSPDDQTEINGDESSRTTSLGTSGKRNSSKQTTSLAIRDFGPGRTRSKSIPVSIVEADDDLILGSLEKSGLLDVQKAGIASYWGGKNFYSRRQSV